MLAATNFIHSFYNLLMSVWLADYLAHPLLRFHHSDFFRRFSFQWMLMMTLGDTESVCQPYRIFRKYFPLRFSQSFPQSFHIASISRFCANVFAFCPTVTSHMNGSQLDVDHLENFWFVAHQSQNTCTLRCGLANMKGKKWQQQKTEIHFTNYAIVLMLLCGERWCSIFGYEFCSVHIYTIWGWSWLSIFLLRENRPSHSADIGPPPHTIKPQSTYDIRWCLEMRAKSDRRQKNEIIRDWFSHKIERCHSWVRRIPMTLLKYFLIIQFR